MVDLGRWLGGGYRVPTDEKPDEAGNPPRDDDGDDDDVEKANHEEPP